MLTDLEGIVYLNYRTPLPKSKTMLKSVNQNTLAVGKAASKEKVKSKQGICSFLRALHLSDTSFPVLVCKV